MKWSKKGHEYDLIYKNIETINQVYLFGAGHDGAMVKQILSERYRSVSVMGFIDNNKKKQGTVYLGLQVYALEEIELKKHTAIIITFASEWVQKIDTQLAEHHWTKGVNFFHYEEFIAVVAAYRYKELFMSSLSLLTTTKCNLRCKACLNFTTYIKHCMDYPLEDLKTDIDRLFHSVDYLGLLHISGGEPFLYPNLAELIQYIDKNYSSQIYFLETVTNGTVEPKEELLQVFRDTHIKITIDDYRESLPQYREQIERNIEKIYKTVGEEKIILKKYEEWIDLYPYPQEELKEEELVQKYNRCHVPWQEYRRGKLYTCNYAAFASVAGLIKEPDEAEQYDFTSYRKEDLKKAMEFRLGFSEKGYAEFCKKCAGYLEINTHKVKPAVQE
ncbi:MAG: radical SAM protein [Lachnospiraceae bacterium]|nr:radical SAM protein [Lachnospiraceae bacterium]